MTKYSGRVTLRDITDSERVCQCVIDLVSMDLIMAQVCVSTQPYFQAFIQSDADPMKVYSVYVPMPGDPPESYICTCPGFMHRGYCKHQQRIQPCMWDESIGLEEQTPEQREQRICPRCGNDTIEELQAND